MPYNPIGFSRVKCRMHVHRSEPPSPFPSSNISIVRIQQPSKRKRTACRGDRCATAKEKGLHAGMACLSNPFSKLAHLMGGKVRADGRALAAPHRKADSHSALVASDAQHAARHRRRAHLAHDLRAPDGGAQLSPLFPACVPQREHGAALLPGRWADTPTDRRANGQHTLHPR
jgi:hypothetical protein